MADTDPSNRPLDVSPDPATPAAPGESPYIGTVHLPHIEPPPAVIHSLGDAHPGEANPTAGLDSSNTDTTAQLLAQREGAERQLTASGAVREHGQTSETIATDDYEDEGANALNREGQPGGRHNVSGTNDAAPLDYLESQHGYADMSGQAGALDNIQGRLTARTEANARDIQRAESTSGLTFHEGDEYEQREFENPVPLRDDVVTGAGTGMHTEDTGAVYPVSAVFNTLGEAQAAVHALQEVGFTADDIALIARQMDGGNAPAGASEVVPAGEEAMRRSSGELPNDEDLSTTYADQAGVPDSQMADSSRMGLSRDEGRIARIEAPADPDIYSDYAQSDADYRTRADEGAAQTGEVQQDSGIPVAPGHDEVHVTQVTPQAGAVVGGLTGLVAGLAALMIPGIGPIIAVGPIAGAIIGALTGGVAGGLFGALLKAGVPEDTARAYAGRIEQGHALVTVQTDRLTRPVAARILAT